MTPQLMLFCLTVIGTVIVLLAFNVALAAIWSKYWHQTFAQAFWEWSWINAIGIVLLFCLYLLFKTK